MTSHVVVAEEVDQILDVARARIGADVETGKDRSNELQPVFVEEVAQRVVIGHDLAPIGRDLVDERPGLAIRLLQAADQGVGALTDGVGRGRRRLDERVAGVLDHHDRIRGAHPVMRVDLAIR